MALHSLYTLTWMLGVPCWLLDIQFPFGLNLDHALPTLGVNIRTIRIILHVAG